MKLSQSISKEDFVNINYENLSEDSKTDETRSKIEFFYDSISEKQIVTQTPVTFLIDGKKYVLKTDRKKTFKENMSISIWNEEVKRTKKETETETETKKEESKQ